MVKPIEYIARPDRMGLGATEAAHRNAKKPAKRRPGEAEPKSNRMVAAVDEDGKRRNWKTLDERVYEHSDMPRMHQLVVVVAGRTLLIEREGLPCVCVMCAMCAITIQSD